MTEILEKPTRSKTRQQPLGAAIDELWKLREAKRKAEAEVKSIELQITTAEEAILERLDKEGVDSARGARATVSVSKPISANVTDWDAFWQYILKKKFTHLLQRRVSDPAYRELLELETAKGRSIPGVEPFTKKKLNLRSLAL